MRVHIQCTNVSCSSYCIQSSPSSSSNPFRNALHKFSKKKEKTQLGNSATSGFFSRASKGKGKQELPLPGSVKQVSAGQLPPVWVTPAPAPPRFVISYQGCLNGTDLII